MSNTILSESLFLKGVLSLQSQGRHEQLEGGLLSGRQDRSALSRHVGPSVVPCPIKQNLKTASYCSLRPRWRNTPKQAAKRPPPLSRAQCCWPALCGASLRSCHPNRRCGRCTCPRLSRRGRTGAWPYKSSPAC